MTDPTLPLVIEPAVLEQHLRDDNLVIVDLCKTQQYQQAHVPGALHLDYRAIIAARPPVMGLLPDTEQLQDAATQLGLTPEKHVVAYDEEGGGKAARLLWTLDVMGHKRLSLLNGGIIAWANEKHPLEATPNTAQSVGSYPIAINEQALARKDYILSHLDDDSVALLDARTTHEYKGEKKFAEKGGHIPGAVNMDWMLLMDQSNNYKLKPEQDINAMLGDLGIDKNQDVVVYCQSHHRSALTYVALKSLGYDKVRGYPGSWSEWGNAPDTPVEQ
jgi:thiosulfate/3-mercaptopyruvate sulfurtransferase